ncbi:membrane-bound alpha-1,6- mannosyltransferase Initiation-specific, partial [Quaeritorhiza haematococci]
DGLPHHVQNSLRSFREKNPDYTQILWTDSDIEEVIRVYFPSIVDVWKKIPIQIVKADLFRYMIVYVFGGVYSDVDTMCLKPIDTWVKPPNDEWSGGVTSSSPTPPPVTDIIGVEFYDGRTDWHRWFARQLQFSQWTFACESESKLLKLVIDSAVARLYTLQNTPREKWTDDLVMEIAGPGVWTDNVIFMFDMVGFKWRDAFAKLKKPRQVEGLYVLPITGLSAGMMDRAER